MKPSEEIRVALDYMREYGWIKHCVEDEQGRVCLLGAFEHVENSQQGDALRALYGTFKELGYQPERPDRPAWIAGFNNHPDVTFEDIELVCKHAIFDLEEQGL